MLPVLGAHGADDVRGRRGVVHVHLGAGDAITVAVGGCDGLHVRLVPLVIGFGYGQGNGAPSGGDVGQQRAFLFFRPSLQNGQGAQGGAAEVRTGHRAPPQLFKEHAGVGKRSAFSPILGGYDDAQPAGGREFRPRFRRSVLAGGGQFQQRFLGVFGVHEATHRRFQHFLFFGQGQVHWLVAPVMPTRRRVPAAGDRFRCAGT